MNLPTLKPGVQYCAICLETAPCERRCRYEVLRPASVFAGGDWALVRPEDFVLVQRARRRRA